jgi:virulence-associated protein VagC
VAPTGQAIPHEVEVTDTEKSLILKPLSQHTATLVKPFVVKNNQPTSINQVGRFNICIQQQQQQQQTAMVLCDGRTALAAVHRKKKPTVVHLFAWFKS